MTAWPILIFGAVLFVAYANGANDNFKGVATLFGSGVTDYRKALWWAAVTTLAGSLAAIVLAGELISVFHGKGLLPPALVQSSRFIAAVILGAAVTVFAATKIGMPISTTHSLLGALLGTGLAAAGFTLTVETLLRSFLLPLLLSPVAAVILSLLSYPLLNAILRLTAVNNQTCVCIGNEIAPAVTRAPGIAVAASSTALRVIVDKEGQCDQRLAGTIWQVNARRLIDCGHFLSAGAVSFGRGLNDAPKIVAIALTANALDITWATGFVAASMAVGGLLSARKVAETVSKRVTAIEPDQGFLANLVTAFLVICASKWGLPVSTTHVSCGSLFGIGILNGKAQWGVIRTILLAWILTLPFAGISAGFLYVVLSQLPVG